MSRFRKAPDYLPNCKTEEKKEAGQDRLDKMQLICCILLVTLLSYDGHVMFSVISHRQRYKYSIPKHSSTSGCSLY
jgi:hypothetical protein